MGEVASNAEINRAVDAYPIFLSRGIEYDDVDAEKAKKLRRYAQEIEINNGLSRNSFAPTLAAINLLLVVAQDLADEALVVARKNDSSVPKNDPLLLIKAINGVKTISPREKKRFQLKLADLVP